MVVVLVRVLLQARYQVVEVAVQVVRVLTVPVQHPFREDSPVLQVRPQIQDKGVKVLTPLQGVTLNTEVAVEVVVTLPTVTHQTEEVQYLLPVVEVAVEVLTVPITQEHLVRVELQVHTQQVVEERQVLLAEVVVEMEVTVIQQKVVQVVEVAVDKMVSVMETVEMEVMVDFLAEVVEVVVREKEQVLVVMREMEVEVKFGFILGSKIFK
jgi:hypothetical protein